MQARWVLPLVLCLALAAPCLSDVFYTYNDKQETLESAQLWYEGYWKQMDTITGTVGFWPDEDVKGKIAVVGRTRKAVAPHETRLREIQKAGAIAVVLLRKIPSYHPGFSMYIIDGSDRSDIRLPVVEASYGNKDNIGLLPSGSAITVTYTMNQHKKVADTKFQFAFNIILSLMEIAIIVIGCYRIWQFWVVEEFTWKATAPFCCLLEVIGALLRLGYTLVDPFYAYRMIPDHITIVLISISFPFSLSAGILLTFFWAESLSKSNVRAVPFISQYRTAAIVTIICLFVIEIITSSLRATLNTTQLAISPNYISIGVYLIIAIVLVACYISCARAISSRIGAFPGKGKRRSVRLMTLRVALSTAGYVGFVIALICYAALAERVWGRQLTLNGLFLAHNWASLMQVIALRPLVSFKPPTTSSTARASKDDTGGTVSERSAETGDYSYPEDDTSSSNSV